MRTNWNKHRTKECIGKSNGNRAAILMATNRIAVRRESTGTP
jgi:hypothetical protein